MTVYQVLKNILYLKMLFKIKLPNNTKEFHTTQKQLIIVGVNCNTKQTLPLMLRFEHLNCYFREDLPNHPLFDSQLCKQL